ncbi:MAG: hypothetical protein DRQ88_07915 [Epsilonproteobacteria bacterium]|nr:MAG: hypothetical protein DRQ89_11260 [Campylobacterota bacterium]RLA66049.1 MAG: hypothetical protein DRQ88_07915 [Campylobacterota bacterium]
MGNIYKSFNDLIEKNKHVFKFLNRGSGGGLAKAVWDSRDAEIKQLKTNINELKIGQDRLLEDNQSLPEIKDKLKMLESDEEISINIIEGLKEKTFVLEDELGHLEHEKNVIKNELHDKETTITKLKINLSDALSKTKELTTDLKKSQSSEINIIKLMRQKEKGVKETLKDYEGKVRSVLRDKDRITNALTKEIREITSVFKIETVKVQDLREKNSRLKLDLRKNRQFVENLKEEIQKIRANTKKYQILNHKMESELYRLNGDLEGLSSTRQR